MAALNGLQKFPWVWFSCLVFLVEFVLTLAGEWTQNEQYSYGWLTPLLVLYLVYTRWDSLNAMQVGAGRWTLPALCVMGGCLLLLIPSRIVLAGNPEWRLGLWLHAGLLVGGVIAFLVATRGRFLAGAILPVVVVLLFAVPWPTGFENSLTNGLMAVVARVVVEGMNWAGVYAEQLGNLIRLRNGWVGIEEACSGVRSLQSTLMAGWFLGELFRLGPASRGLLLLCGVIASFLLNVARTLTLTILTYRGGEDLVDRAHDPMGHFIGAVAFLSLLGIALGIRAIIPRREKPADRGFAEKELPSPVEPVRAVALGALRFPISIVAIVLTAWIGASHVIAWGWYARAEVGLHRLTPVEVNWTAHPAKMEFPTINPIIRNELRFSDGQQAEWRDAGGQRWTVFFFSWTDGRISPFLGVHTPETCLPATGFERVGRNEDLVVEVNGSPIIFESTSFSRLGRPVEVFFATWSNVDGGADLGRINSRDRFVNAWRGQRLLDRQSLQIVIRDVTSRELARAEAEAFIRRVVSRD